MGNTCSAVGNITLNPIVPSVLPQQTAAVNVAVDGSLAFPFFGTQGLTYSFNTCGWNADGTFVGAPPLSSTLSIFNSATFDAANRVEYADVDLTGCGNQQTQIENWIAPSTGWFYLYVSESSCDGLLPAMTVTYSGPAPAPVVPPVIPPVGGSADPFMTGFQGQHYFFDGEDAKWYNCVSDPAKKMIINMRLSYLEGHGTFIDGLGIVVPDEDGDEHTISLAVDVAKDNFTPECTKKAESSGSAACLGKGAIALEIDGAVAEGPGLVAIGPGLEVFAINAPFGCKSVPHAHFHWDEQVAHLQEIAEMRAATGMRRLLAVDQDVDQSKVFERLLQKGESLFNEEECAEWVSERLTDGAVFDEDRTMSTIFIDTPAFTLRVEYTMNEDDSTWVKHHRMDYTLSGYTPASGDAAVGGVLGETGSLNYDSSGQPILKDRSLILSHSKDSDYETNGPFGKDFVAKP